MLLNTGNQTTVNVTYDRAKVIICTNATYIQFYNLYRSPCEPVVRFRNLSGLADLS